MSIRELPSSNQNHPLENANIFTPASSGISDGSVNLGTNLEASQDLLKDSKLFDQSHIEQTETKEKKSITPISIEPKANLLSRIYQAISRAIRAVVNFISACFSSVFVCNIFSNKRVELVSSTKSKLD